MSTGMEIDIKSFKQDVAMAKNQTLENVILKEEDALKVVQKELTDFLQSAKAQEQMEELDRIKKDKIYLRKKKIIFKNMISDIIDRLNLRVVDSKMAPVALSHFLNKCVSEFAGYSILEDAFLDDAVTDIFIVSWDKIYVETNGDVPKLYKYIFRNEEHFEHVIKRLLRDAAKEVNGGDNRIVDLDLYGDRFCVTHPTVSAKGYSATIRKHSENHIKLPYLIEKNVMSQKIADFLGLIIKGETNIIYAGITGSGKTTAIRALVDHYVSKLQKRIVCCEDTRELFLENEHTLELVTVKDDDEKNAIPLGRLVETALRLKPKYIIVGEVRGVEIMSMVEAMETGHSTITTMHGATHWNIVNRAITKYMMAMPSLGIDVVERILGSAIDYIAIQDDIPGIGRRVTSITEVSYDFKEKRVVCSVVFKYNFETNEWDQLKSISEEKADKMIRRGVKMAEIKSFDVTEAICA